MSDGFGDTGLCNVSQKNTMERGSVPSPKVSESDRDASTHTHSLDISLSYISTMTMLGCGRYVCQNAEPGMD